MGVNGFCWPSVASSKNRSGETYPSAYNFNFNVANVYSSDGPFERWIGRSLRWLANHAKTPEL